MKLLSIKADEATNEKNAVYHSDRQIEFNQKSIYSIRIPH